MSTDPLLQVSDTQEDKQDDNGDDEINDDDNQPTDFAPPPPQNSNLLKLTLDDLSTAVYNKPHVLELNSKTECPITLVTVYNDRADITRDMTVDLKAGTTEITITGLTTTHNVDTNSIRVLGARGDAVILEVSGNISYTKKNEEQEESNNKQLKEKIENINKLATRIQKELDRIKLEHDWIEGWSKNLLNPEKDPKKPVSDPFLPDAISDVAKFLEFYQDRLRDIDARKEKLTIQQTEMNAERSKLQNQLSRSEIRRIDGVQEIVVSVYCKVPTKLQLQVAYIVMGASWTASYDIRVTSGERKLEINYYGNITNASGEDWEGVNLVLSTAQPSVAGKPPDLTQKWVSFATTCDINIPSVLNINPIISQSAVNQSVFEEEQSIRYDGFEPQVPDVMTTKATDNQTSASFSIPRKATIASDNKPHKVTIRLIKLKANYTYIVIPNVSLNAYLKASIKNTAKNYPFLAGPVNVFMDNNLVAKSKIPLISSSESWGIFLGVDPSIKIDYQTVKQTTDTQGWVNKTNKLDVRYNTVITNNKPTEVKLSLFDNLPKSNVSTIKVKLIEPEINDNTPETHITAANNIEWKKTIPAKSKIEIPLHYTIEYPIDKSINF